MKLYVPRALRGVVNKKVSVNNVCDENESQQVNKVKSDKPRVTSHINALDNLPSVSSEHKLKESSVTINLKSNEKYFNNTIQFSTSETAIKSSTSTLCSASNSVLENEAVMISASETVVKSTSTTQSTASNNVLENEAVTISTSYTPTEADNLQTFPNRSSSLPMFLPCDLSCADDIDVADNANSDFSENVMENIDETVVAEISSINSEKGEIDGVITSVMCESDDIETNTIIDHAFCSAQDTKNEVVSSTATSDSCYTSDMDLLNISDKSEETEVSLKEMQYSDDVHKKQEDSWESMFNEEGECLDSDLVKELSSVTGKIQIRTAKNNYTDYQPISENVPQEYENIVELYGFPREFVTQDLVSAFSAFQQSCFSIKWVDDCHALAIFTSPTLANQALQINHPFMKVRPLSEGIKESKAKARWCAHHSEPQKPRPATSAVLARRLVSGALGLRVQATKEQRDHEKTVLKEAKEKRRLKAKQKEAIWDGSVI